MHRPLLASTALSFILLSASPSLAASEVLQEKKIGMQHMMVGQPPAPATAQAAAPVQAPATSATPATPPAASAAPKEETPAASPAPRKPLSVDEALIKPEALKTWSRLSEVVTLSTPEDTDKMVRIVEADPGSVPPQALFFLARSLSEQNRMDEAALYYYVAQLRLSFDVTRWPPRLSPEDAKRLMEDKNKSPDQAKPNADTEPKIKNPHEGMVILSTAVGGPITEWILKDPDHAAGVMAKVAEWDLSAPYAYLPNYALPQATPYEEWKTILPNVRQNYFSRMDQFITGLKKLKAQ